MISVFAFGQRSGKVYYGFGGLYNFQTKGAAWDIRARIPVYKDIFISPRFSDFPVFNRIHEYYLGTDAGIKINKKHNVQPYAYVGGYYNNWMNSYDFYYNPKAQKNNFVFEGGAGIIFCVRCFRPYIEYRYDTKWKEGSLGAGILFNWSCFRSKKASEKTCPKFKKRFILF